jgi:hypothetical protein
MTPYGNRMTDFDPYVTLSKTSSGLTYFKFFLPTLHKNLSWLKSAWQMAKMPV